MTSIRKLEIAILSTLIKIRNEFPDWSKYLAEMPQNVAGINKEAEKRLRVYANSLAELVAEYAKSDDALLLSEQNEKESFPGYPLYPPAEDIYIQGKKEATLNPEDLSKKKAANEAPHTPNEKGFKNHMSGADLDVPGSELDDQQESVGSEDEENNYYSLGGDDHIDLEENNG